MIKLPLGFGNLDWSDWFYGLFAAIIGGGSSAVTGGIVVSMNDPSHYNFQTKAFYELMGAMFMANGLLTAFAFLRTKPLPEMKKVEMTVQSREVQGQPTSVTTTTKETEMKPVEQNAPTL